MDVPELGKFKEEKIGGLYIWTNPDATGYNKDAKKIEEKIDRDIGEHAEVRSDHCLSTGCRNLPFIWVKEVKFLIGEIEVKTTVGLKGPIPGICYIHEYECAQALADWAYGNEQIMKLGVSNPRYEVVYTDGTKTSGVVHKEAIVSDQHVCRRS